MAYLVASLAAFRSEANALYPNRDKSSDGWIGDAAHSSRTSDHNPDWRGAVHAYDLDEDLDGNTSDSGAELAFLAEAIRSRRDPRVKYVIYEGRIFASYATSTRPAWTWGPYSGTNAHRHHMHVSVLSTDIGENDTRPWFPTSVDTVENDYMPYPVYYVPNGGERGYYLACGPGGYVRLNNEEWEVGRDFGWFANPVAVNARQYDVLASLADRLG
jgi:hypothetical protein